MLQHIIALNISTCHEFKIARRVMDMSLITIARSVSFIKIARHVIDLTCHYLKFFNVSLITRARSRLGAIANLHPQVVDPSTPKSHPGA